MIQISTFGRVPVIAQGLERDLRVRWALEEAGLPYVQRLLGREDMASADYRCQQPFGQVPVFEEDGTTLFESGAIVMHIAERSEQLLPRDAHGRARAITWMFAALNSVEPRIQHLTEIDMFHSGKEWAALRRPEAVEAVVQRLLALSAALGERDYLEGRFSAGDLLMTTVLRIVRHTELLAQWPNLEAYRRRCEARPAFAKALADHMAVFAEPAVASA
ncbi:MAG: glutathione S-transferase family protein [Tahibacter sp.]